MRTHVIAALAALTIAGGVAAQEPMGGLAWQVAPAVERWTFGCCTSTDSALSVRSATEWSVPVIASVPVGGSVSLDAYVAWTHATVSMRGAGSPSYTLDGFTDTRLRASVRLGGDALLATFGVNLPTGKTTLSGDELAVESVIGAPALRFETPALGTGWGGTGGLVYTRQIGAWSYGLGASYEYRGQYSPAEAQALGLTTGSLDLRPGQAIRLSLGAGGLVGQSAMSVSLASTLYTRDRISVTGLATPPDAVRLGPMFTVDWRLRASSPVFRELTVYAFDRYRMKYDRGGQSVPGTSGNEAELGLTGRAPLSPTLSFVAGVHGRHYTGLGVDNTIATAAGVSGGLSVGLAWSAGPLVFQPSVGGDVGRLDTGGQRLTMYRWTTALTIGAR